MVDMAKMLKQSAADAARYSKRLLVARRDSVQRQGAFPSKASIQAEKQRKGKKVKRSTLKYTFANWLRYFFGDFPDKNGPLVPGPPSEQPLRRVAFLVFWLSRFVFIGPPGESVSLGVCMIASLLAEGKRLPLAPLYLGSLYTQLD